MECENEACDGRNKDCCLIHRKGVLSFFKIVINNRSLQVLVFPPKFARSVSHLSDQETYLEDSSGQRWRVSTSLLKYLDGMVVKRRSLADIDNRRKRARSYPEVTTPSELFQTPDINLAEKKSKKSNESEFATNIDAETGKGQSVHSVVNVDESFCMIDRNSQYDQEDDRLCLDLSSFEMPASGPLAEGTSNLLKGDTEKDKHVKTNLRLEEEPNLNVEIGNLNSESLLSKLEAGITTTNMVSRPAEDIPLPGPKYKKSNKASQFENVAQGAQQDMFSFKISELLQKESVKKHRPPPSEDIDRVYDVDPISWAPPASGNTSFHGGTVPFTPPVAAPPHVSNGNSMKKPRLMGECDTVIK